MRDFFKGWRRKIGVLTLVMACVCMAAWVRSYSAEDKAWIPFQTSIRTVRTCRGCLHLCYANCESDSKVALTSVNQIPQDVSLIETADGKKRYVIVFYNSPRRFRWTTSLRVAGDTKPSGNDP